jgi:hypothetical protein
MSEEAAEVVRNFVPGDELEMEVELAARSNITSIQARFLKDKDSPQQRLLMLSSDDYELSARREGDVRFTRTILTLDEEQSHPPMPPMVTGDYWLDSIHVTTHGGTSRRIDHGAWRVCIRIETEPAEDTPTITSLTPL